MAQTFTTSIEGWLIEVRSNIVCHNALPHVELFDLGPDGSPGMPLPANEGVARGGCALGAAGARISRALTQRSGRPHRQPCVSPGHSGEGFSITALRDAARILWCFSRERSTSMFSNECHERMKLIALVDLAHRT